MGKTKNFRDAEKRIPEEKKLLEVASYYSSISPGNIVAIGGTLTLPEISGYKRLRLRSGDVDFVVNDEGLEALLKEEPAIETFSLPEPHGVVASGYEVERMGVLAAFFHNEIRGFKIPEEAFSEATLKEASAGPVYVVPNELNLALKIRRGLEKIGEVYGKDGLDAGSTIMGMERSGKQFDSESFVKYLVEYVCSDYSQPTLLEAISRFGDYLTQLPKKDRRPYMEQLALSTAWIEERKNYQHEQRNQEREIYVLKNPGMQALPMLS